MDGQSPRPWGSQCLCRQAACLGPILAGEAMVLPTACGELSTERCVGESTSTVVSGGAVGPHQCFPTVIPQMTPISTLFIDEHQAKSARSFCKSATEALST